MIIACLHKFIKLNFFTYNFCSLLLIAVTVFLLTIHSPTSKISDATRPTRQGAIWMKSDLQANRNRMRYWVTTCHLVSGLGITAELFYFYKVNMAKHRNTFAATVVLLLLLYSIFNK